MYKEDCVFCREIVKGKNAAVIFENHSIMAFMDIAPVETGHVLVIPKEHYVNIMDIEEDTYIELQRTARRLAPPIIRAVNAEAVNIGQNNGACANQKVFHYHLHIIPRVCDRRLEWSRREVKEDELGMVAEKIVAEINNPDGKIPVLK